MSTSTPPLTVPVLPRTPLALPLNRAERRELAWVAVLSVAACVALSLLQGRDLNWDYFNYHGYAAQLLRQERLAQDFWAAGVQGYLNPLPLLPFAWMQATGWHSAAIASVLAAVQALNLLLLYLVARRLATGHQRPVWIAATATALGAASSVFVSQLGSTFVDTVTTPLVMAALLLLMTGRGHAASGVAAALAGAAMALKWTNAPYALGILAAALAVTPRMTAVELARRAGLAGASLAAGFLLLYGQWGWQLYREFGSPVFPLFNGIFRSPDFSAESASYHRYVPQTLGQLISLPFRMAEHRSWVYTEVMAPDLRPGLLLLLAVGCAVAAGLRRWRPTQSSSHHATPAPVPLLVFFVVSSAAWIATSTNGRYATPLLLLLGPLLYMAARPLLGERRAVLGCMLVLVLQCLHAASAGNPRWNPQEWTQTWLPGHVPESLRREPTLFVVVGRQSESYLAALVHPQSAFTNPIGLVSLPTGGPGWSRFEQLRDRFAGRTRLVFRVPSVSAPAETRSIAVKVGGMAERLGLKIDAQDCERLAFNAQNDPVIPTADDRFMLWKSHHLLACKATPLPGPDPVTRGKRLLAQEVMDAFERQCPQFLAPRAPQIEGAGDQWERYYGKFDLFLSVDLRQGVVAYRQEHQVTPVIIGRVAHWRSDAAQFACALPHGGVRGIETLGGPRAPE